VNDCYAHNGATKRIQLIDEYGCPVDDKLISRFRGSWSDSGIFETQVYAYMKTFRFTGSPALYIECDVRMCHGRCPSQPCHWRNLKSVTKREVTEKPATNSTLSDNINLFQSLRVLQDEDENEYEKPQASISKWETNESRRIGFSDFSTFQKPAMSPKLASKPPYCRPFRR
jgi:Zona pellucida-like domain